MRILCWGTYDTGKPRTRILRAGLSRAGNTLHECHRPVWDGIEDKSQVPGGWRRVGLVLRWLLSYPSLVWRFMRAPRPDVLLIGFPGVLDALVIAPFARLRGVPVVWDMFMSLYDTIVEDRQLLARRGIVARVLHAAELCALRRCDLVFLDTEAHARRVESLFALPAGHCGAVWVGAEVEHFAPALAERPATSAGEPMRVLFYGQFIPLHGIETIVAAARLMKDEPVEWTVVGRGQEQERIARLLTQEPLPRLRREEWVEYGELCRWIARADLCLGIFGTSGKAASVIPNKVFQIVAMGRPLVTRDSPAIRELLEHAPPCTYLVPCADPRALAAAVRDHLTRMPTPVANCHAGLHEKIGASAVARQFTGLLRARLARRP
jgi:glycosyltransferase involved in cell wall biosynthesis